MCNADFPMAYSIVRLEESNLLTRSRRPLNSETILIIGNLDDEYNTNSG